jgi:internalin A
MIKPPAMEQIPALIQQLEIMLSGKNNAVTLEKVPSPEHWAKPLSYAVNDKGEVIALNLKGIGLRELVINKEWKHVQRLDISSNDFTTLSFEMDLPALELLEISYNKRPLEKLIFNTAFDALKYLYVYKAQLQNIQFAEGIPQLLVQPDVNINLGENKDLPPGLSAIFLEKDTTEISRRLINYFKEASTEVERVKLILLGNTNAGKTTLHDILNPQNPKAGPSTHGINLFTYKPKNTNIQVQGFDFGGQDYYHSTHLPFFSSRALYLLVWGRGQADAFSTTDRNNREEAIYPLSYWLGSVDYFRNGAADGKKMEHISTQGTKEMTATETTDTVTEKVPEQPQKKSLHLLQNIQAGDTAPQPLNHQLICKSFPFTGEQAAFTFNNTKSQEDIIQWVDKHIKDFCSKEPALAKDMEVAELLSAKKCVILSMTELATEPVANGYNAPALSDLVKRLHDTLYCYYLNEADLRADGMGVLDDAEKAALKEKIVIRLDTFTSWIYTILHPGLVVNGYFTKEEAKQLLKDKADKEASGQLGFILAFMLYHKIIFKVKDEARYIAPNYLPQQPGIAASLFISTFEQALVKYSFEGFYHTSIITEILAKFFDNIPGEEKDGEWHYLLWKNKVLLYDEPVQEDDSTKKLSQKMLYINFDMEETAHTEDGEKVTKQVPTIRLHRFAKNHVSDVFLTRVMDFIEQQIAAYKPIKQVITPGGQYIPFTCLLQKNQQDGQQSNLVYHEGKIYRKGDFNLFLDEKDKSPMKKIFISYSKDDLPMVNQFIKHLAPLKRSGLVEKWYCTELMAGSDWDATIQAHFDAADIVCFMVSHNFLATNYIYEYELKKAFERRAAEEKSKHPQPLKIVPIILEYCSWTGSGQYNLAQYTALPYIAKPIADFKDQNMGWYVVVESLKYLIENFQLNPTGNDAYADFEYPEQSKQMKKIFERIVKGQADNNA